MPARDPVQAHGVAGAKPVVLEHGQRIGVLQRSERKRVKPLEREPGPEGPLAAGEQQAGAGRQRRYEHLPQPGVHQPEHLVVVEREHERRREPPHVAHERLDVVEPARGGEEPALGRLDRPAVEQQHGRAVSASAVEEGPHEAGLADPGDPVHAGDQRLVALEQIGQGAKLRLTPDERPDPLGSGHRRHRTSMTAQPTAAKTTKPANIAPHASAAGTPTRPRGSA